MASTVSRDNVTAALVPVYLDNSRTDKDRAAKLAKTREASAYQRREAVMAAGRATVSGSEAQNRDLAEACMAALKL